MMSQPLQRTSRRRAQRLAAAQNRRHQEERQQQKYRRYAEGVVAQQTAPPSSSDSVDTRTANNRSRQVSPANTPNDMTVDTSAPAAHASVDAPAAAALVSPLESTHSASASTTAPQQTQFFRTGTPTSVASYNSSDSEFANADGSANNRVPSWEDYEEGMYRRPRKLLVGHESDVSVGTHRTNYTQGRIRSRSHNHARVYNRNMAVDTNFDGNSNSNTNTNSNRQHYHNRFAKDDIQLDEYGGDPSLRTVRLRNNLRTAGRSNSFRSSLPESPSSKSSSAPASASNTDKQVGAMPIAGSTVSRPNTPTAPTGSASSVNSRDSPVSVGKYGTLPASGSSVTSAATHTSVASNDVLHRKKMTMMMPPPSPPPGSRDRTASARTGVAGNSRNKPTLTHTGLTIMLDALASHDAAVSTASLPASPTDRKNSSSGSSSPLPIPPTTVSSLTPKDLSTDELALWNAFQKIIRQRERQNAEDRKHLTQAKSQVTRLQSVVADQQVELEVHAQKQNESSPADLAVISELKSKLKQAEEAHAEHRKEHESSMRAIQRVMADLSAEKEQGQEEHEQKLQQLEARYKQQIAELTAAAKKTRSLSPKPSKDNGSTFKSSSPSSPASKSTPPTALDEKSAIRISQLKAEMMEVKKKHTELQSEKTVLQREMDKKVRRILNLERDAKMHKFHNNKHLEETKRLKVQIANLQAAASEQAGHKEELRNKDAEIADLRAEIAQRSEHIEKLQLENKNLRLELQTATDRMEMAVAEAEKLAKAAEEQQREMEAAKARESEKVGSDVSNDTDAKNAILEEKEREIEWLSQQLEQASRKSGETSASLESAKMIITSLENANSSLSHDLRAKLKSREDELSMVRKELDDRKQHLDSLATELRDLQLEHAAVTKAQSSNRGTLARQKVLIEQLQSSISGLQSAAVVHEVSASTGNVDSANVEHAGVILNDALVALQTALRDTEEAVSENRSVFQSNDDHSMYASTEIGDETVDSEVGRHVDNLIRDDREAAAKELRQEIDQQRATIADLQNSLTDANATIESLRRSLSTSPPPPPPPLPSNDTASSEHEIRMLRAEVQSLKDQCATNMEVLTKKERELTVLRASLKIDDSDGGYISDDPSDDEDEDEDEDSTTDGAPISASIASPPRLNGYGPKETEALAAILAAQGGGSPTFMQQQQHLQPIQEESLDRSSSSADMEVLKNDLRKTASERDRANKELKVERESLANAKMIISSLEKANKSMMENLRSRLQDSNTAIASLLDKSMEHETTTKTLRNELEALKREKLLLEEKHEQQVQELRDENTVLSLQLQTKNPTDGSAGTSEVEEKKEDPAGAEQ